MAQETVISFKGVEFFYDHRKPLIEDATFNVRSGAKITLMGQNGAGKSTIFKMINGTLEKKSGIINIDREATIATGYQVVLEEDKNLTV